MSNTLTQTTELSLEEKRALLAQLLQEKASKPKTFPLSFSQQRLWFLDQLEPESASYNIPQIIWVKGSLNATALERCFNEIVRRHEVLRTTFVMVEGDPVQSVAPSLSMTLPVTDLREWPEAERKAEVQRLATEDAARPFDLTRGPLLRIRLLRLGDAEHALLVNMHHIISDGWSLGVFVRELTALYDAFSVGRPSPLAELPIQYADYAMWQREWLQGAELEKQLAYWREQLNNSPAVLELPTDRARPAVQSYRGAKQSMMLSKSLSEALQALSQREGVTLFMTLLAAFQTLLARYSGQDDIVVGTPIAGRTRAETEGLIGFFVNTLVLRTNVSDDPTFRELLWRVKETTLGAYAHQDVPFEKLVEELQPERSLSHTPLFQIMFVHLNMPQTAAEPTGLSLRPTGIDSETSKFDLTLLTDEKAEGLRGWFEYNTDLFDASTIKRMVGHLETLLAGIIANPDARLSELPLLTETERQQLLVEWNDTRREYPREACVHELFEAQVKRTPDAVAGIFGGEKLTYAELNRRANQVAHYLRARGIGPEARVGIMLERSLEMVVGLLGILKAGGAYVPLDVTYPQERLRFMLADAEVSVLVTQQHLVNSLPQHTAPVVCLDAERRQIARERADNIPNSAAADNLAYVIYTSGSTGRPKGVALPHRALVNLLWWQLQSSTVGSGAKTLQFASLSFDVSFQEIFSTWCAGGVLVLISEELRRDAVDLLRFLTDEAVARLFLPFVALRQLAEVSDELAVVPASLREVITAGEQLQITRQIAGMFSKLKECRLHNHYGPSETHVVTAYMLRGAPSEWMALPPIGRPIWNTRMYVLDGRMKPVPVGVVGELYIGGECLARGYLKRPELTAERFVRDPFSTDEKARLYKTGDQVRYLEGGELEYLGRFDTQVKIRGFRIELGEVEAALAQHAAVAEAVVVAREDVPGDKHLVAYVVAVEQQPLPTTNELRSYLKAHLPEYMVPSVFATLEALPLTPSGKIDRRALPAPDGARPELAERYVAPQDELELQLTRVWERVLGVQPIGMTDNFFDLGGHSLLAVRLFAQIEKEFGKNLPLATLFQAPTVEQLAGVMRHDGWSASWSSLVPIKPNGSRPPIFCVHSVGANILNYRQLAQYLDKDQPFYGLQSHGLDGKAEPHSRIEEMAAHYIKEIRTVQPEGPYSLAGGSSGGLVAFEMAQQLYAQGERVALLALIDTYCPGPNGLKYLPSRTLFHSKFYRAVWRVDLHLGYLLLLKPKEQLKYIFGRPKRLLIELGREIKKFTGRFYPDVEDPVSRTIQKVRGANYRGISKYVPEPYPGRITLFWASITAMRAAHDNRLGWSGIAADGLDVQVVPGNHTDMLIEPNIKVLAERLEACLRRAQQLEASKQK